jgi:hypothetical protein
MIGSSLLSASMASSRCGRYWPIATFRGSAAICRFRGQSGHSELQPGARLIAKGSCSSGRAKKSIHSHLDVT